MRLTLKLFGLLIVLAGIGFGAWRALDWEMDQPAPAEAPQRMEVPAGAGLRTVLNQLQRQGLLRHARLVALYLRLHGVVVRAQAGIYEIAPHSSARAVLDQLNSGRVILEALTVVEGWSFAQLRHELDVDPTIAHQLRGLSDAQVMTALGHEGLAPEGQFFPDTYRFAAGTSDRKILEGAFERMQSALDAAWANHAPNLPLADKYQALIMASIVEKETGREDERSKVAAVFFNRLRLGMKLQTDPSVIYGLGDRYDGTVHTRDLEADTPYNTYTRAGLPPTPIALPGAASLDATMHPADTDALYFVATGEGGHRFSATLAEHDAAVRAYLQKLGIRPAGPKK